MYTVIQTTYLGENLSRTSQPFKVTTSGGFRVWGAQARLQRGRSDDVFLLNQTR